MGGRSDARVPPGAVPLRGLVTILVIDGLILLAFSPIRYAPLAGSQHAIVIGGPTTYSCRPHHSGPAQAELLERSQHDRTAAPPSLRVATSSTSTTRRNDPAAGWPTSKNKPAIGTMAAIPHLSKP
jgi:hypothetical protein